MRKLIISAFLNPQKNKFWTTAQDGIENLTLQEGDMPVPGEGQVLIKIQAVSLNAHDVEVVKGVGQKRSTTKTPCSDMCGTVVTSLSPKWKVGDRVMGSLYQGYVKGRITQKDLEGRLEGVLSEFVVLNEEGLVKVPKGLGDGEASCLPSDGITAWEGLWSLVECFGDFGKKDDGKWGEKEGYAENGKDDDKPTVLIQGTTPTALTALQIATAARFKTLITSASESDLALASALGATHTINTRTHWEYASEVLSLTSNRGADVVFNGSLKKAFECVAVGGQIVCTADEEQQEGDRQGEVRGLHVAKMAVGKGVVLKGVLGGSLERFEGLVGFLEKTGIKPVVGKVFKFEEVKEAFTCLEEGEVFGKVVIRMS